MDVANVKSVFDRFQRDAADGLLASDIFARADAQPILGYNTNPAACALFNKVVQHLIESLAGSKFPPLHRYILIDLAGNKTVVVVNLSAEYLWGMLCDTTKIQLGMLLNVIVPTAAAQFQEAIKAGGAPGIPGLRPAQVLPEPAGLGRRDSR